MQVIEYCRVHISNCIHKQCTLNIADSIIANNKFILVSYHTEVGTPTLSYQY
jgi:hypothetical protein